MKKLQHLLCLLLCLALCAALFPAALAEEAGTIAPAEDPAGEGTIAPATDPEALPPADEPETVYTGTCGANLTWSLDTDSGVLIISGTGDMDNWTATKVPWYKYQSDITLIILPNGLTSIGSFAFFECKITSITIPANVTKIGERAFLYCQDLTTVSLPEGLTEIGDLAFTGCIKLTGITIPASVTDLGYGPFADCTSLPEIKVEKENPAFCARNGVLYDKAQTTLIQCPGGKTDQVTVPASVTTIGGEAFAGCSNLASIRFEGSAPSFGSFVFQGTTVTVYYPGNDPSWTAEVRQNYEGTPTWTPIYPDVFTDVTVGKYYYYPVLWAYYHDPQITGGMTHTSFGPGSTCTRGQIMTFLWKAAGAPGPTTTDNPFDDVKEDKYYYKAVLWAYENGITSGLTETSFGPNSSCTRAQVMSFLWRFAESPQPTATTNPFEDVDSGKYYYKAVLWAVENGITSGMDPTHFGPNNTCTRGQIVTFLYKFMEG